MLIAPRTRSNTRWGDRSGATRGLIWRHGRRAAIALVILLAGTPARAQTEMATVDADGSLTVHAVRLTAPLRIDGRLDEELYRTVTPLSRFIQTEPQAGDPATEKTDVWVAFDRGTMYVTFRVWETQLERLVSNELRRDNNLIITANDHVAFSFDTFHDRRNALIFMAGPNGGRVDGQSTGERQYNADWNPVWNMASGKFDRGWTVEMAIPFTSLRYRPDTTQVWGFTARRVSRWKNEIAYITHVPDGSGLASLMKSSFFATLDGIQVPSGSKNLEIKPYTVGQVTSDVNAVTPAFNDVTGDVGIDVKYGITQNLTADLTYNTDFAQVEADEQQVNLTRFSLFFPEKREFFLENQGTFSFGGATTSGAAAAATDTPTIFYSRRVGLEAGRAVPIRGGGRVTGRLGRVEVGLLSIESSDEPISRTSPTNFSVVRLKRDLFRKSSVGAIFTRRSETPARPSSGEVAGVDGAFSFGQNLTINTYWARARTPGVTGDDTSYRTYLDYNADRYGVQVERLVIDPNFIPEIGFVRRPNMRKGYGLLRFSPRPKSTVIRKYSWIAAYNYIENGVGQVETRQADADFSVELQNSDKLLIGATSHYEFLAAPFRIAPSVTIPVGHYEYSDLNAGFNFGRQRRIFANVSGEFGEFYDGHHTTISVSGAYIRLSHRLSIEPTLSLNWVDVPAGSFRTNLAGSRVTFTFTPKMFVSALMQYNSLANLISSNVRLRWEYSPGSELFVVYNDQRDTLARSFPALQNRAFIVKINRLFRL